MFGIHKGNDMKSSFSKLVLFVVAACMVGCSLEAPPGGDCGNNKDVGEDDNCQCVVPKDYDEYSTGSVSIKDPGRIKTEACTEDGKYDLRLKSDEAVKCVNYKCEKRKCPEGLFRKSGSLGVECVEMESSCGDKEVFDFTKEECICNGSLHYIGTAGHCECEHGYKASDNGKCEPDPNALESLCEKGEIYDVSDRACVCDTDNHWIGQTGNCQCENGYIEENGRCRGITDADRCVRIGEKWDPDNQRCICDAAKHWTGNAGSCRCQHGYIQVDDNECQKPVECKNNGEILDESTNTCLCDKANHWVKTDNGCTCANGFAYNESTSKCDFYACKGAGQIYVPALKKCVCDENANFEGTTSCQCKSGYQRTFVDECMQCRANEKWNSTLRICESNQSCTKTVNHQVGSECTFGKYMQKDDTKTDIEWIVLKNDTDEVLFVSKYALDTKPYHVNNNNVIWKYSTLRSWLNGFGSGSNEANQDYLYDNFMDDAFSKTEQYYIKDAVVENNPNTYNGIEISGGGKTKDNIFVLSNDEIKTYSGNGSLQLKTKPTEYAMKSGALVYEDESLVDWWLRTPGGAANRASFISKDKIDNYGKVVNTNNLSIRPAFWLCKSRCKETNLQDQ